MSSRHLCPTSLDPTTCNCDKGLCNTAQWRHSVQNRHSYFPRAKCDSDKSKHKHATCDNCANNTRQELAPAFYRLISPSRHVTRAHTMNCKHTPQWRYGAQGSHLLSIVRHLVVAILVIFSAEHTSAQQTGGRCWQATIIQIN